ncbi:MAG: S1C family serine protease [Planctomycetota bacterium]
MNKTATRPLIGRRRTRGLLVIVLAIASGPAPAQTTSDEVQPPPDLSGVQQALRDVFDRVWAPRRRYVDGPQVRPLFRAAVAEAARTVVQVRSGGRQVALGAVVGPDGWILTKASAVGVDPAPRCRLADGDVREARVVGIDREYDLAMLKVEASRLPSLDLAATPSVPETLQVSVKTTDVGESNPSSAEGASEDASSGDAVGKAAVTPQLGDWLVTVGRGRDPIAVGVVSAAPRAIPARPGFLGVQMSVEQEPADGRGVIVEQVLPSGGAKDAGVRDGDVIEAIDGKPTNSPQELKQAVSGRSPGDAIDLTLRRGGQRVELRAILSANQRNPAERRALYQNRLGGPLSERRFGFPNAMQHDTVLAPRDCGGPVVDLDGVVVGFNLARAGRTESYAVPTPILASRLVDLMSGKLAPSTGNVGPGAGG